MTPPSKSPRTAARRRAASELEPSARETLMAVAVREFADHGFEGASTVEIARRAGITQPMINYHFGSKAGLWEAAIGGLMQDADKLFSALESELKGVDSRSQLVIALRRILSFNTRNPEFGRLMAREGIRPGPRTRWLIRTHLHQHFEALTQLFKRGVEEGWMRPLPVMHVIFFLIGAAAHLAAVPALAGELYGVDVKDPAVQAEQADAFIEMMLHGLLKT
jgi:TetR/AcrR family transcriptional regulator